MTEAILRAMQLDRVGEPLRPIERPLPSPEGFDLLIEVSACGVCRTDLHIVDGELHGPLPVVPGHEIVGRVIARGPAAEDHAIGARVGVPWLGRTCGHCFFCRTGRENLCDDPSFTGFSRDGGYATHCLADSRYCFAVPEVFDDVEAAPLLCAGLIGYRSLKLAGAGEPVGFYGFGAAAHILTQLAVWQGRTVFALTRPGDTSGQDYARSLGCAWAGGSDEPPPEPLDAAIIFAPVGALVPLALKAVRKGGRVVCAGIHMSDIPAFPYRDLWEERSILSVANLTRDDGREFLALAAQVTIRAAATAFALTAANQALSAVRDGRIHGAAVLVPEGKAAGLAPAGRTG
jgi:propanol-preferring alcohol dehydrogenase